MTDETRDSVIGAPLPPARTLPFPPAASGSTAGRTMQESTYSPKPPEHHLPADRRGQAASAFALRASNSACVMVPAASSCCAFSISAVGEEPEPLTLRM